MDYKIIEETLDKLAEMLEEKLKEKKEELKMNEKAYEESKKELKKDILSRIDKAKDVIILITDREGSISGKRENVVSAILDLLDKTYSDLNSSEKKDVRRIVNDIFKD